MGVREEDERVKSVRDLVTDRSFLAPLTISCSCFLFQAMCGCDTISYYTGYIFKEKQMRMEHAAIIFQMTITFGYLVSSFILSKLDCRIVNIIFLIPTSLAMMVMGLSFMFPSLTTLSIPSLVFSGLCYGLGVGPVSFVLMSSLYPQKMKSVGVAVSQTCRALIVL